jgi:hypothetical protein
MNRQSSLSVLAVAALLAGCSVGHIRTDEVNALGRYRGLPVRVAPPVGVGGESSGQVQAGVQRGLAAGGTEMAERDGPALIVQPRVTLLHAGQEGDGGAGASAVSYGASMLGFAGHVDASRMTLELWLFAPDRQDAVGRVIWDGAEPGSVAALVDSGASDAGRALAADLHTQRGRYVTRAAADERFVLTPGAQLLQPGEIVVSDDEVLLAHTGVGVTRWLQLDASLGGLIIPAAGGMPFVGHGAGAVGGAGAVIVGAFDLGLKLRLHDEAPYWPALSFSYDLLDLFGGVLAGGGVAILGAGVGAAAAGGAGGVNVQLNLFTVAANKHLGERFQVGGGLVVVDNHHIIPQGAAFAIGVGGGTGEGGGGTGEGGTTKIDRLPGTVLPFVNAEFTATRWLRIIQEVLPARTLSGTTGVTGFRFILGGNGSWGPFSLRKLKVKLDLAAVETWHHSDAETGRKKGFGYVPWIGLGFYFM